MHPHLLDVKGCHPERCKKRIYDTCLVHIVFPRHVHAFSMGPAIHSIFFEQMKIGEDVAGQKEVLVAASLGRSVSFSVWPSSNTCQRAFPSCDLPEASKFPVVSDSDSCYPSNAFVTNHESMKGSLQKLCTVFYKLNHLLFAWPNIMDQNHMTS